MLVQQINFGAGAHEGAAPLVLAPGRVTLFIGPNNGGKSQALRDIASKFTSHFSGVVLSDVTIERFSDDELDAKLESLSRPKFAGEDPSPFVIPVGRRGNFQLVNKHNIKQFAATSSNYHIYAQWFLKHLIINLDGQSRLNLEDQQSSVPVRSPATSTMSILLRDDILRGELSDIIFDSFGQYLVIDPTAMSQMQYALSLEKPSSSDIERSFTEEATQFFERTKPVNSASDGTRAFVGIMSEVMAGDHDVLLIDEPEAFLHPSLAYTLGREITRKLGPTKQLFAATHSPHFLMGCVDSGLEVDIIRLTYSPSHSTARSLPKEDLKIITTDPLLKSIGVTSALFYQEAIVCEGDSDRAFYAEIASRLTNHTDFRHSVFLNGHGKQTMPRIVEALRALGIPSIGIMDLDWIKEDGTVAENYLSGFGVPEGMKEALRSARRAVRTSLERTDPKYKSNGGISLLSGDDRRAADNFIQLAKQYGIFTVPVGEIEHWLANLGVGRTKTKWLQEIFFAIGSDPNSENYVRESHGDVWEFLKEVGTWLTEAKKH
jgi:ABC-type cobalamin/Fe3+-siderophores transport system ATPase subunit